MKSESEVAQSCPTLSDPMDYSQPGSVVHGIFQARVWSGVPLPSLTMEHYSAIKKNKILPFAETQKDLEDFTLTEISQTEKEKYCVLSHIYESKKVQQ